MDGPDHLGEPMKVAPVAASDAEEWLAMRSALWPRGAGGAHAAEIAHLLVEPGETITLLARDEGGSALGFAEISLRRDYVNGCNTSPVAFLEGIYVVPPARGTGVARALIGMAQAWARQQGCTEMASDAALDNAVSHAMHKALGFAETQRVVFFRKSLG